MRRLWRYRQFRIGFTALTLLIAILLTQYFYRRTIQWFSLLGDSGLVETQAKITAVNLDGSIRYEFMVPGISGSIRTYNILFDPDYNIGSLMNVYGLSLEVQALIPIVYVPDAPEFSVVSKQAFGDGTTYAQLLEDYVIFQSLDKTLPWSGSVMIGLIAFIILLLQCLQFLRRILVSR